MIQRSREIQRTEKFRLEKYKNRDKRNYACVDHDDTWRNERKIGKT
jgi:hypothetical protein